MCRAENAPEASVIDEIDVIPVDNLMHLILHLLDERKINPAPKTNLEKLFSERRISGGYVVCPRTGARQTRFGNCRGRRTQYQF